jgi:hypothetical protein
MRIFLHDDIFIYKIHSSTMETKYNQLKNVIHIASILRGCDSHDCMIVVFTSTHTISVCHHLSFDLDSYT